VTGSVLKFEGFLKVYEESKDAKDEEDEALKHKLPVLVEGQKLTLKDLLPEQHFTEPPPRFNEASLVKELEERGIGRPQPMPPSSAPSRSANTYRRLGGKFIPTEIGMVVTDLLVANFKDIFDPAVHGASWKKSSMRSKRARRRWTDALEGVLQEVREGTPLRRKAYGERQADGKAHRREVRTVRLAAGHQVGQARLVLRLQCLRQDRSQQLHLHQGESQLTCPTWTRPDVQETTQEEYCENCGRPMVLKRGRFGQFMACTGYPDCKTTRRLDQGKKVPDIPLDEKCPQCGRNLLLRHGRFGEFISCSGYPDCKWVKQNYIGVKCPECKTGDLAEKKARRGNLFYGCSNYPKCKFTSAYKLVPSPVPECGSPYLLEKNLKAGNFPGLPQQQADRERRGDEPKRRGKKKAGDESTVKCDYSREIKPEAVA
jgi:DNA topoisomerase-1